MKTIQKGFTLIELIVVIVILGILAASALPRFINATTDARIASMRGMEGAVRSAAALAHAEWLLRGQPATITMEGNGIQIVNGYPTDNDATDPGDIALALSSTSGFTITRAADLTRFDVTGAPTPATCSVSYTDPAAANTSPTITTATAGC